MRRWFSTFVLCAGLAAGAASGAHAGEATATPRVVVSIAPIHSLASQVMDGIGRPRLLLPPGASEHAAGLRPSDARALADADLVIWVGPMLETGLGRSIASLAREARVLTLIHEKGLALLPVRSGGAWEDHEGHDHAHGPHGESHGESQGDGLEALGGRVPDAHIWLDPDNARAVIRAMAHALTALDHANAHRYRANAERANARIGTLDKVLAARLAPVRGVAFVVFHDAYQYFERHYGLAAVGAVTLGADRATGARRLLALRERIRRSDAGCVFAEPQFEPRLVATLVEGTEARTGVLDPLGASIPLGAAQYQQLMRNLAAALADCLGRAG